MKNNTSLGIILPILIIVLLLGLLNPFNFHMLETIHMMIVAGLIVSGSVLLLFVWRERVRDEREEFHRMLADRIVFLTGAGVLIILVVIESLMGRSIIALTIALVAMMVAKAVSVFVINKKI